MKALVDQNLSHRLVDLFQPRFPGSCHVRDHGLSADDDEKIWSLARDAVHSVLPQRVVPVAWLAAVATVVVASLPVVAHPEGPTADRAVNPVLEEVFAALGALEDVGPVRYDTDTLRVFEPYSSAVMMELQARGIEFRVSNEGMVRQLGNRRRASGDERVTVFQLEGIDALPFSRSGIQTIVL